MKTYLLYGSDACAVYNDGGIDELIKCDFKKNTLFGEIDVFDRNTTPITNLLLNYTGWGDFTEITEKEYFTLDFIIRG